MQAHNHSIWGIGTDRRVEHIFSREARAIAHGNHDMSAHELLQAIARPMRKSARGKGGRAADCISRQSDGYKKMIAELITKGIPTWLYNNRWEKIDGNEPPWEEEAENAATHQSVYTVKTGISEVDHQGVNFTKRVLKRPSEDEIRGWLDRPP